MIVQIVYLTIAIVVLTLGLAFIGYRAEYLQHKVRVLEMKLNKLEEEIEIRGNHIDHIYNVLISVTGELKSLEKEIHQTDTDVKI